MDINQLNNIVAPLKEIKDILSEISKSDFSNSISNITSPLSEVVSTIVDMPEAFKTIGNGINKFGELKDAIGPLTSSLIENTIEMGKNVAAWIAQNAQLGFATVATWAQQAATVAQNVATQIGTGIQSAFNAVMAMNPIALIIIAVVALVAAFVLLWNKCEGFRNFFIGLWDKLKDNGAWIGEKFAAIWEGVGKVIAGVWNGIKSGLRSVINFVIKCVNTYLKGILLPINLVIKGINLIPGVNIPELTLAIPQVPEFSSGGFPPTGQMFLARETGPELVGSLNGRTAVVNNDQIVESVSQGVYKAVKEAMGNKGSNIIIEANGDTDSILNFFNFKLKQQNYLEGVTI